MSQIENEIKNLVYSEVISEIQLNFHVHFETFLLNRYSINLDQLDDLMRETFPEKLI
jgi:hypothetical protein